MYCIIYCIEKNSSHSSSFFSGLKYFRKFHITSPEPNVIRLPRVPFAHAVVRRTCLVGRSSALSTSSTAPSIIWIPRERYLSSQASRAPRAWGVARFISRYSRGHDPGDSLNISVVKLPRSRSHIPKLERLTEERPASLSTN